MTSPIGHSLAGLTLSARATNGRFDWRWALLLMFSANAADLDFVPGLLLGDANRFHHLATHSLLAALIWAGALGLLANQKGQSGLKFGVFAGLAYASHLLLDYFTIDAGEPYGMLLWWPFADSFVMSDAPFFQPVEHGNFGDSNLKVIALFFSPVNLFAVALELTVLIPVLLFGWWWSARRAKKAFAAAPGGGRCGENRLLHYEQHE